MPADGSLCAGGTAPRIPLEPLEVLAGAEAPLDPRMRCSGTRHSPGTKVCLFEVEAARSRHPGQLHSTETSWWNLHWPKMRL